MAAESSWRPSHRGGRVSQLRSAPNCFHVDVSKRSLKIVKISESVEGTLGEGGGRGWRPPYAFFLKSTFDVNRRQQINI